MVGLILFYRKETEEEIKPEEMVLAVPDAPQCGLGVSSEPRAKWYLFLQLLSHTFSLVEVAVTCSHCISQPHISSVLHAVPHHTSTHPMEQDNSFR